MSRNARDLLELINNVLDLSKIEAGRMDVYAEPADARDVIERAMAVVEPLKEARPIQLSLNVEAGLPAMRTDRTKLQQILINLISNAIKFTREGEVRITAERAAGDRIRIAVSDTGIGIPESEVTRIFEEFRQIASAGRGARTGTGLGLSITRRLVEMLEGEINVSSREGEGSTFAVTLPWEIEGRVAPASETEIPLTDPERTALVIDTDPASLYLTKKYLTEAGYSVAATDDPARGLEIAGLAKPARVFDTRKTTPGLRELEKYAVRCGGGYNHRMGLHDGVMIKDNHIAALGDLEELREKVVELSSKGRPIVLEAASHEQALLFATFPIQVLMLDNFSIPGLRRAVRAVRKIHPKLEIEASGGVNLGTVRAIARTGVDRVSVGALTHSAPAVDISLEL